MVLGLEGGGGQLGGGGLLGGLGGLEGDEGGGFGGGGFLGGFGGGFSSSSIFYKEDIEEDMKEEDNNQLS